MSGWCKEWVCLAPLATAFALWPADASRAAEAVTNVRLANSTQRFAVALALSGAAQQFGHPECQGLLDDFKSASGQPLRDGLAELGMSPTEYLTGGVFFYDAPERLCGTSNVAVTRPGSRAVLICGSRFVREMKRDSRHLEAVLIHEMLHSLGLGENPPGSDEITARVRARCGQSKYPPPASAHVAEQP
jgi:hypothetical protein